MKMIKKIITPFKKLITIIFKRKYYICDTKALAKLNSTYFADFKYLADNAVFMRKRYRKKMEKIIYKRYKRDCKRINRQDKLNRTYLNKQK